MKNNVFTQGEILMIQTNLKAIEKGLGRTIPGGLIDASDLRDHLLTQGEILNICYNIDQISGRRASSYVEYRTPRSYSSSRSPISSFLLSVLLLSSIGVVLLIVESIMGWSIL